MRSTSENLGRDDWRRLVPGDCESQGEAESAAAIAMFLSSDLNGESSRLSRRAAEDSSAQRE